MRKVTGLSLLISGVLLAASTLLHGQGIYQISTDEKISRSSFIAEGKVIEKRSYWNAAHTMIYTTNRVEVYKVFKGSTEKTIIDIITVGGNVGSEYIHASHMLELNEDELGIFFCNKTATNSFDVYSSSQGFLRYDLRTKKAVAPFSRYDDIEGTLYKELNNKIGQRIDVKNRLFSVDKESRELLMHSNSVLAPAITNFSPTTVNAGALLDEANNVLTITGSGFGTGAGQAAVLFPHVDFAPGDQNVVVPYNSPLVLSWADGQIRVRVPSQAATGTFGVRDNAGAVSNSSTSLNVFFSILTADLIAPYGLKQFNLGNNNGEGGYGIKYSTNTANSGVNINASDAKATFQRALTTWVQGTGVNFTEDGTTNLQVVDTDDGNNIIMFDNSGTGLAPLAAGVLATCYSGITICTDNANNQALKAGFDIVIRNTGYSTGSVSFTFGPCPPYSLMVQAVDLESVLLHELGHALNLGHIRSPLEGMGPGTANPALVMNYSVSLNHRRISLDNSALRGAQYQITKHNRNYGTCVGSAPEMTALETALEPNDECPINFPVTTTPSDTTVTFRLDLATSNKSADPAYTQFTTNGTGANVTNTAYFPIRTNSAGGRLALVAKNYRTYPEAIEDCPLGLQAIDISGVKLSIYRVSACPQGGSFPTPVFHTVFDKNDTVLVMNNLPSSTNYLMVLDGVQNTKASFDLQFTGEAILERIIDIQADVLATTNRVSWTIDTLFEVASIELQRSADGITFTKVADVVGAQREDGQYSDETPFPTDNYYRLAINNTNGTTDYSAVVRVTRSNEFNIAVMDNPIRGAEVEISVLNNESNTYGFVISNAYGQKVAQRQVQLAGGSQLVRMNVAMLPPGVYMLSVYDSGKKSIKTIKLVK